MLSSEAFGVEYDFSTDQIIGIKKGLGSKKWSELPYFFKLSDVVDSVISFKTLTSGDLTFAMGNWLSGGYITGQNTASGARGGVTMNGVLPQLYYENTTLGDDSFRLLMEAHGDGVYVSHALTGAEWVKLVEQDEFDAALQDIDNRINALAGLGGALPHKDFGASPAAGQPLPEAWQETLTEYACKSIWGDGGVFTWNSAEPWSSTYVIDEVTHTAVEIFNSTWVRNDNDNHKFVLTNTPNTNPQIFDWADVGIDAVAQFTDTLAGVIKGDGTAFGKVKSNTDGTGSVNGLINTGDGTKALLDNGSYGTLAQSWGIMSFTPSATQTSTVSETSVPFVGTAASSDFADISADGYITFKKAGRYMFYFGRMDLIPISDNLWTPGITSLTGGAWASNFAGTPRLKYSEWGLGALNNPILIRSPAGGGARIMWSWCDAAMSWTFANISPCQLVLIGSY